VEINLFNTPLSGLFIGPSRFFLNRIQAVTHLCLSFFRLRTTMMASSHPPIAEKPSSLCPPPHHHAFLSSVPPFFSAGMSVSSSAAVFCNSIRSTLMFCVQSIYLSTQHSRARDPLSLCSCYLFHAFPSPLPPFCSAPMPVGSTQLQQSYQVDSDVILRAIDSTSTQHSSARYKRQTISSHRLLALPIVNKNI
jgi:hypothetical protein